MIIYVTLYHKYYYSCNFAVWIIIMFIFFNLYYFKRKLSKGYISRPGILIIAIGIKKYRGITIEFEE